MALPVKDFPSLVRWLADKYHDGAIYPMGARTGLSPAILQRWADGNVKSPTLLAVVKFSDAYGLDYIEVLSIVAHKPRRTLRKGIAALVGIGLLASILGAPEVAAATAALGVITIPPYRKLAAYLWRRRITPTTSDSPALSVPTSPIDNGLRLCFR